MCERDRTVERENALMEATLEALWRSPGVHRVEAQLLLLESPLTRKMPFASWFRPYPAPISGGARRRRRCAAEAREPGGITIAPWTEAQQDDSARLVAAAYRGHIDSEINDQYRSPSGARRFSEQHRAVSGMRDVLRAGVLRGVRERRARTVRHFTGEPGGARYRPHHADLRGAVAARQGRGICAAAAVHAGAGGARMPHEWELTVTSTNAGASGCMSRWDSRTGASSRPTFGMMEFVPGILASAGACYARRISLWRGFRGNGLGAEGSGEGEKRVRTEGLWLKCEGCRQIIWKKDLEENGHVCPQVRPPFPHGRARRGWRCCSTAAFTKSSTRA